VREPRLRHFDPLLPALIGLVGVAEIVAGYEPRWLTVGTYLLAAGVLALARMVPLAVPLLVTGIYATTPLLGFDVSRPAFWVVLIAFACFVTGLHASRSRRLAGLAAVLVALLITLAGLSWLTDFEPSMLFGLIVGVGSWAFGLGLREALDQNRRAAAQAERARVDCALAAERAAKSERERIAVELPDVLARSLGAMVVQSSAASDLVGRDPAVAARVLQGVADAGAGGACRDGEAPAVAARRQRGIRTAAGEPAGEHCRRYRRARPDGFAAGNPARRRVAAGASWRHWNNRIGVERLRTPVGVTRRVLVHGCAALRSARVPARNAHTKEKLGYWTHAIM
jgi:hypothetical protein